MDSRRPRLTCHFKSLTKYKHNQRSQYSPIIPTKLRSFDSPRHKPEKNGYYTQRSEHGARGQDGWRLAVVHGGHSCVYRM